MTSGDENGSDSMKYWEIVADKLSAAGWSWGYCSAVTKHGWRWWIVDAHKGDGKRYIVQSDELLSAFWNWKRCCCECGAIRLHLAFWRYPELNLWLSNAFVLLLELIFIRTRSLAGRL